jgi:hypothetical protein
MAPAAKARRFVDDIASMVALRNSALADSTGAPILQRGYEPENLSNGTVGTSAGACTRQAYDAAGLSGSEKKRGSGFSRMPHPRSPQSKAGTKHPERNEERMRVSARIPRLDLSEWIAFMICWRCSETAIDFQHRPQQHFGALCALLRRRIFQFVVGKPILRGNEDHGGRSDGRDVSGVVACS